MKPATKRALVTGGNGQLGRELRETVPAGWSLVGLTSDELDITRPEAVASTFDSERPGLVINAAAYTAVDNAERESAEAEAVNVRGAANVAESARRLGARLIQVSTDFVFGGERGRPYLPADAPGPLGVYGRTKLEGEREVARMSAGDALIVRTAWLYSARGHNFVLTMLRRMGEREELGVVSDQVGTPTWCRSLAEALWAAAERPELRGVHHWTDAGVASWYDFAVAIQEEACALGLLRRAVPIRPLLTAEYPTPARRPSYSVLDATATAKALGLERRHWRANLRLMLRELPGG